MSLSQKLLQERARELLARGRQESQDATECMVFNLGEQRVAVELTMLVRVLAKPEILPVPGAGPQLLGVLNDDGVIRPVVDLRRMLALPPSGDVQDVLMLSSARGPVGIAVDRGADIQSLSLHALLPLPDDMVQLRKVLRGLAPGSIMVLARSGFLREVFSA